MVKKICLICGKEFEVIPCREKTAKYCSTECQHKSLHGKLNCKCDWCGKEYHKKTSHLTKNNFCSRQCFAEFKKVSFRGENNHQWGLKGPLNSSFKGVELKDKNNRVWDIKVYCPNHPRCDSRGRVSKHRLLVEEHYKNFDMKYFEEINGKFYLKKSAQVHHINFDHDDNRIENLMPVTRSEHTSIHNLGIKIIRDTNTGKITGVIKQGELLEKPEEVNQQPSQPLTKLEGSETNG